MAGTELHCAVLVWRFFMPWQKKFALFCGVLVGTGTPQRVSSAAGVCGGPISMLKDDGARRVFLVTAPPFSCARFSPHGCKPCDSAAVVLNAHPKYLEAVVMHDGYGDSENCLRGPAPFFCSSLFLPAPAS